MTPISIDGKDYDADALSAAAKAQLMSLQVTDQGTSINTQPPSTPS